MLSGRIVNSTGGFAGRILHQFLFPTAVVTTVLVHGTMTRALAVAALAAIGWMRIRVRSRPAKISLGDGYIDIHDDASPETPTRISAAELVAVAKTPLPSGVVVTLEPRAPRQDATVLELTDPEHARAVQTALRVRDDAGRHASSKVAAAPSWWSGLRALAALHVPLAALALLRDSLASHHLSTSFIDPMASVAGGVSAASCVGYVLWLSVLPIVVFYASVRPPRQTRVRVDLGAAGILISEPRRSPRFIPYETVASAFVTGSGIGLRLTMRSGAIGLAISEEAGPEVRQALVAAILTEARWAGGAAPDVRKEHSLSLRPRPSAPVESVVGDRVSHVRQVERGGASRVAISKGRREVA